MFGLLLLHTSARSVWIKPNRSRLLEADGIIGRQPTRTMVSSIPGEHHHVALQQEPAQRCVQNFAE